MPLLVCSHWCDVIESSDATRLGLSQAKASVSIALKSRSLHYQAKILFSTKPSVSTESKTRRIARNQSLQASQWKSQIATIRIALVTRNRPLRDALRYSLDHGIPVGRGIEIERRRDRDRDIN
jgi:hypothetical protein